VLVTDYVEKIKAPQKRLTLVDGAGHFVAMSHTPEFVAALREDVRLLRL